MKLSIITSVAALLASANAVVVYKTEHFHVTVTQGDGQVATVDAQSDPAPTPTPSQPDQQQSQPPAPTSEPAPASTPEQDQGNVQQAAVDPSAIVNTVWADAQGKVISAGAAPSQPSQQPQIDDQDGGDSSEPPAPQSTTQAVQSSQPPTQASTPAASSASASAAPSSSSSGSLDLTSFAKGCLNSHNTDRAKHSAPSMKWNETLASYAKDYLSNQNCVFAHSGGPYGENIAMGYSSPEDAISAWYKEGQQYSFGSGGFSEATGHFTQMIWKESTQLGCAQVDCGSKGTFFSCEYFPRGNVISQFVDNVLSS